MAVVKVGLAALTLVVGTLAAAECARAQTEAPGAKPAPPMARLGRQTAQVQPPAPQPKAPVATPSAPAPAATPAPTPAPAAKTNARGPEQEYKECLNLWDAATHMTRTEWAATCRRIQNRLNDITSQAKEITGPTRRRAR